MIILINHFSKQCEDLHPGGNFDCRWIAKNAGFIGSKLDLPEFVVLNNAGFKVRMIADFGRVAFARSLNRNRPQVVFFRGF